VNLNKLKNKFKYLNKIIIIYFLKIDDVNGFDNTILTPFKERVESNGMSVEDLNLVLE